MRLLFSIIILFFNFCKFLAQPSVFVWPHSYIPIFQNEDGKYCIKNKSHQTIILERNYDNIEKYGKPGYNVQLNNKFGLINNLGKEIISTKYSYPNWYFKNGLIYIEKTDNEPWKLIDTMGNELSFSKKYDNISFSHHAGQLIATLKGKTGLINVMGNEITPLYDNVGYKFIGGDYHLIRERTLIGGILKDEFCLLFRDAGAIPVKLNGKWGIIDTIGKQITALKFDSLIFSHDGVYKFKLNNEFLYVNAAGQEIVKYDTMGNYSEGLTGVCKNKKWGFINIKGKEKIQCKYQEVLNFNNGLVFAKQNNKWGVINNIGKEITPFKYDLTDPIFYKGVAGVTLNGRRIIITRLGQEISKYDIMGNHFFNGLLSVKLGNKWGFIDSLGQEVIPLKYDSVVNFELGLAQVELNNKWGVINNLGQKIVEPKYDQIIYVKFYEFKYNFYNESEKAKDKYFIVVKLDNKFGAFDLKGNEIAAIKFDEIIDFSYHDHNTQNLYRVKLDNKYGLIDETGNEITPIKYDNFILNEFREDFPNSYHFARVNANDKWGIIDETGKEIIPVKYDYIDDARNGLFKVSLDNKFGFINGNGKVIIPLIYDFIDDNIDQGKFWVRINEREFYIDKNGNEIK